MIRQLFDIENYWRVIVYYNLDYDFFGIIGKDLQNIGASKQMLRVLWYNLYYGKAKAATYSNLFKHVSIVLFNTHFSEKDYINSIVHEAEHVKQAMLKAYYIADKNELPAYTIGHIIGQMWEVFKDFVCSKCSSL